jgi:hypothetical protein
MQMQNTMNKNAHNYKCSFDKIEKQCPGFKVIAGPFVIRSQYKDLATIEQAAAVKVLKEQRRNNVDAKIVTSGRFAFVLRTEEGWVKEDDNRAGRYSDPSCVKAGRMAAS